VGSNKCCWRGHVLLGRGAGGEVRIWTQSRDALREVKEGDVRILLNGGVFSSKVESWAISLENRLSSQSAAVLVEAHNALPKRYSDVIHTIILGYLTLLRSLSQIREPMNR
jgi:hypothetical protein